eukprot:TRINITY_DN18855_c0_g1_i1.p1 TRINITY_DN18855_c0_g1~~TRINITY_DN18855_c0_g1_i1.p1  ORF type:complete len:178 (-),score=23.79 TRINITY_DN18855_c0_g1_i1:80-580(-)
MAFWNISVTALDGSSHTFSVSDDTSVFELCQQFAAKAEVTSGLGVRLSQQGSVIRKGKLHENGVSDGSELTAVIMNERDIVIDYIVDFIDTAGTGTLSKDGLRLFLTRLHEINSRSDVTKEPEHEATQMVTKLGDGETMTVSAFKEFFSELPDSKFETLKQSVHLL